MVDSTAAETGMLALGGQSNLPFTSSSRALPDGSIQSDFQSMLDLQLQQADLEAERREVALGWNSTFGAEGTSALDEDNLSEKEKAHQAATGLESILVSTLLKQMWASVDEGTLFGQSMGSQFYREMWLDEMASKIAENQSLGIAQVIEQELLENIERTVSVEELATADVATPSGIEINPEMDSCGYSIEEQVSSGFPLKR